MTLSTGRKLGPYEIVSALGLRRTTDAACSSHTVSPRRTRGVSSIAI